MQVTVLRRDVIVKRSLPMSTTLRQTLDAGKPDRKGGGTRRNITAWTPGAARRLVLAARNGDVTLGYMITLTYPSVFPQDGREVKRHWAAMRKWLVRRGVCGLWFLEFQDRGAPHYHVFVNVEVPYLAVAAAWYRICDTGDKKHLVAGTRVEQLREVDAAARYAEKYAIKPEQKVVPEQFRDVGRFWGRFGGYRLHVLEQITAGIDSSAEAVNRTVRVCRNLYNSFRSRLGVSKRTGRPYKPFVDKGVVGFKAFNCGPWVRYYMACEGYAS